MSEISYQTYSPSLLEKLTNIDMSSFVWAMVSAKDAFGNDVSIKVMVEQTEHERFLEFVTSSDRLAYDRLLAQVSVK